MTTQLKRFTDAYATLTFAVYEPLILRWYSGLGVQSIADGYIKRAASTTGAALTASSSSAMSVAEAVTESKAVEAAIGRVGATGHINATTPGFEGEPLFTLNPKLEITHGEMFFGGRMTLTTDGRNGGPPSVEGIRVDAPPLIFGNKAQPMISPLDNSTTTLELVGSYKAEIEKLLEEHKVGPIPASELKKVLLEQAEQHLAGRGAKPTKELYAPEGDFLEFLSPIGIAHFYRQIYFYVSEGVGPIEQAFTIAPRETLEILTETIRRQSHEEIFEQGHESVSESAVESRNVDEVSDKVASMVERDSSMALSANTSFEASGGVGVWNFGGSVGMSLNSTMSQSSQTSTEIAKRRLKEVTRRAAERITKTFSIRVRDTVDYTSTNLQRRVIQNETADPTSYGLRRVFNRINVKVQNLGPNLVWQLYVSNPGAGLARSRFVHFGESQDIASPGDPPAVRPRPTGGIEGGTMTAQLKRNVAKPVSDPMAFFVTLAIPVQPDQEIKAVSIESISDLEHLEKTDFAPSPTGGSEPGTVANGVYTVKLGVWPGDSEAVSVTYQYRWDPSTETIAAWAAERDAALEKFKAMEAEAREKALREQFERQKALITERSKIRPRAAADLRNEERYEILNRMISHLFKPKGAKSPGAPVPLEIELFHRYFDLDAMFVYVHPSWWVPRYAGQGTGFDRPPYEITAESEPAKMGRSLGWAIQLDGDTRRNEFINSPWVRTCLPIRPGREREALDWLAEHVEGDIGYDATKNPIKGLITAIEGVRANQQKVLGTGPDYVDASTVVVSSTTGAPSGPLKPSDVYPVVDEFEVTVPSEGFVYDALVVKIP